MDFFAALEQLITRGVEFRVSVIGEQFRDVPPVFDEYREKLASRIDRWGFQPSQEEYRTVLAEADVFVSTANHEFFGIAAVEAMAVECWPLLPDRLAYPELLAGVPRADEQFMYDGSVNELARRLTELCTSVDELTHWRTKLSDLSAAVGRFDWIRRAAELDDGMQTLLRTTALPWNAAPRK